MFGIVSLLNVTTSYVLAPVSTTLLKPLSKKGTFILHQKQARDFWVLKLRATDRKPD